MTQITILCYNPFMEFLRRFIELIGVGGSSTSYENVRSLKLILDDISKRNWCVTCDKDYLIATLEIPFHPRDDETHEQYIKDLKAIAKQFFVDGNHIICRVEHQHLERMLNILNDHRMDFLRLVNDGVTNES